MENTLFLSDDDFHQIRRGDAISQDYFYIPVVHHAGGPNQPASALLYEVAPGQVANNAYASKVSAGQTLHQAIVKDLQQDFGYPTHEAVKIEQVHLHDAARNRQGQTLTRLIVQVTVADRFDTARIHPVGLSVAWQDIAQDPNEDTPDEKPTISPHQFLAAFYEAVQQERDRQGIHPEEYTSIVFRIDNSYVEDFLSGEDQDGMRIMDSVSGGTMSPSLYHGYSKPLPADFSQLKLIDHLQPSFDLKKPTTLVTIGNVNVIFSLCRIDKTGRAIKEP